MNVRYQRSLARAPNGAVMDAQIAFEIDARIPLAPNWISFVSNGHGKTDAANVTLHVR
ncbi:MAG: hypothetical protein P4L33_11735 [Capsulimonadaceae bacterium]|nr:hypothetical protein [Capsulimonadaceae bacterium]